MLYIKLPVNKVLGFIRRFARELRVKAFETLVRPRLEHCSSVWDLHVGDLVDKIESIRLEEGDLSTKIIEEQAV